MVFRFKKAVVVSGCIFLIILIGPSRIYLGEHWVSDVIGSYIIGFFWLIILIQLYEYARMSLHFKDSAITARADEHQECS